MAGRQAEGWEGLHDFAKSEEKDGTSGSSEGGRNTEGMGHTWDRILEARLKAC